VTGRERDAPLAKALDSLARARGDAEIAVASADTPESAFKIATDLAAAFREAAEEVAGFRAREAARVRDSEKLSLGGLADRLGISKTRADQLMRIAKTQQARAGEAPPAARAKSGGQRDGHSAR
jgi:hypothetical protein